MINYSRSMNYQKMMKSMKNKLNNRKMIIKMTKFNREAQKSNKR